MGEMLSQEEINALLKGIDDEDSAGGIDLSDVERDSIGEVSNISMGTAATTLYSLINQKVLITTPTVSVAKWEDIAGYYDSPFVTIQIVYKEGLQGSNLMILKEKDAKIIANLMMGGDGIEVEEELTELHLSAVGEAMNQMVGSAATSMSSMFKKKIDIQPPISKYISNEEGIEPSEIADFLSEEFIKVTFELKIGELVNSEMMQLYAPDIAKEIHNAFTSSQTEEESVEEVNEPIQEPINQQSMMSNQGMMDGQQIMNQQPMMNNQGMMNGQPMMNNQGMMNGQPMMNNQGMMNQQSMMNNQGMMNQQPMMNNQFRNVEVQQAQFQNFNMNELVQQKENIDLIMDVPLEVTVELGRTHKTIKEILDFSPGKIIELNKLVGEPIDILVNGKVVANGEVVVIDENFGIRIVDIVKNTSSLLS